MVRPWISILSTVVSYAFVYVTMSVIFLPFSASLVANGVPATNGAHILAVFAALGAMVASLLPRREQVILLVAFSVLAVAFYFVPEIGRSVNAGLVSVVFGVTVSTLIQIIARPHQWNYMK